MNKHDVLFTALLLSLLINVPPLHAETMIDEPKGVYATIDTKTSAQAIAMLTNGTDAEKAIAIHAITTNSDKYCPAVFFSLSAALFDKGNTDDALFWLYAGRIRTQYDIRRCTDQSVMDSYEALNAVAPDLLKLLQFEDIPKTKKILEKAIKWDGETPYNYDPRWIALHGINAFNIEYAKDKNPALTTPEKEWKELAEKNRQEYAKAFYEDIDAITPEQFKMIKKNIEALRKK